MTNSRAVPFIVNAKETIGALIRLRLMGLELQFLQLAGIHDLDANGVISDGKTTHQDVSFSNADSSRFSNR